MLHNVPDTKDLLDLLADVKDRWENIGKALKVNGSVLMTAFRDHSDTSSRLSVIVDGIVSMDITWEAVIDAMESLGEISIAKKIHRFASARTKQK